jgi:hypothetical protein
MAVAINDSLDNCVRVEPGIRTAILVEPIT